MHFHWKFYGTFNIQYKHHHCGGMALLSQLLGPDMLVLGLYPADTPQQLCSVTLRHARFEELADNS